MGYRCLYRWSPGRVQCVRVRGGWCMCVCVVFVWSVRVGGVCVAVRVCSTPTQDKGPMPLEVWLLILKYNKNIEVFLKLKHS